MKCKNRHERNGPIIRPSFNQANVTSGQMDLAATISQSTGPTNWQSNHSQFPALVHAPLQIVHASPVVSGIPMNLVRADQQQVSNGVMQAMATADAARRKMENPTYDTVLNRLNTIRARLNQAAIDLRLNEPLDTIPFYQDEVAATDVASAIAASSIHKQMKWRNVFTKAQGDLSVAATLLESLNMSTSLTDSDPVVKQAQQKVNDASKMLDILVCTHAGFLARVSRAQTSRSQELVAAGTQAYSQRDSRQTGTNFDTANVVSPEIKSVAKVAATLDDEVITHPMPTAGARTDVCAGQFTRRVNENKVRRQYPE